MDSHVIRRRTNRFCFALRADRDLVEPASSALIRLLPVKRQVPPLAVFRTLISYFACCTFFGRLNLGRPTHGSGTTSPSWLWITISPSAAQEYFISVKVLRQLRSTTRRESYFGARSCFLEPARDKPEDFAAEGAFIRARFVWRIFTQPRWVRYSLLTEIHVPYPIISSNSALDRLVFTLKDTAVLLTVTRRRVRTLCWCRGGSAVWFTLVVRALIAMSS